MQGYCVHNQLATTICNELLLHSRISKEKTLTFTKALTQLSIKNCDDPEFFKGLSDQVETLLHVSISFSF